MKNNVINILFIGNSYTHFNDMPQLFEELAKSGGHAVFVDHITRGGAKLCDFINDNDEISRLIYKKLYEKKWDYVVLQEQSMLPAAADKRENITYPSIRVLDKMIKSIGAKTVLYMTWGRKYGLTELGFNNFEEMQEELKIGYEKISKEISALVSPVGLAWKKAIEYEEKVSLWDSDDSHPNISGSYLTACVFYRLIFEESPVGLKFASTLLRERAFFFQNVAEKTF